MFTFRPREHLRRPVDFRRVYERRRSASDERLIVYVCENGLAYLRLGLSVSRKFGPAHMRNRFKRLGREAFRLTREQLPVGLDLVLIPRSNVVPDLIDLQESLKVLVTRLAARLAREGNPR